VLALGPGLAGSRAPLADLLAIGLGGPVRIVTTVVAAVLLPLEPHTAALLVTGCFTLVYVIGTAAALRLLPGGGSRVVAGIAFAAVVALLWLNGPTALLSLVIAGGALAYQRFRRSPVSPGR
jgi:amino acid efflux transporter